VQVAAEHFAKENRSSVPAALRRVERYAREIVPRFNAYFYFRIGYLLRKVDRSVPVPVRLGYLDAEGIAKIAPDATVAFVMNHRSTWITSSRVSRRRPGRALLRGGEWARLWPLSALIRAMGAYFVRRDSKDDCTGACSSATSPWRRRPACPRRFSPKGADA